MFEHGSRKLRSHLVGAVGCLLCLVCVARAQPTYKLDVKPHLKPVATLQLDAAAIRRSAVKEDPGFRLQYHFKKDGKTLTTVEARSNLSLEVPQKEAGTYSAALELFYPTYKTGAQQKGEFKPISNVLTYRIEPGAKPGDAVKIMLVETAKPVAPTAQASQPALVIQCGKGNGKQQDELIRPGYGYKLLQGTAFDGWPASAGKTHCWQDPKSVRFEVTLPSATAGVLRLHFFDGDGMKRNQRVLVQGKLVVRLSNFGTAGQRIEVPVAAAETKDGKINIVLENVNLASTAVISAIEFVPAKSSP